MYLLKNILLPMLICGQCHILGKYIVESSLLDLGNNNNDDFLTGYELDGIYSDKALLYDEPVESVRSSVPEQPSIPHKLDESFPDNLDFKRHSVGRSNKMDGLTSRSEKPSILLDRQNKPHRKAFKSKKPRIKTSASTGRDLKSPFNHLKAKSKDCAKLLSQVQAMNQNCGGVGQGPPTIPIELGSPVNGNDQSSHSKPIDSECKKLLAASWKQRVENCKQASSEPPPAIPIELGSPLAPKNDKQSGEKQSGQTSSGCPKLKGITASKLKSCEQSGGGTPPSIPIELGAAVTDNQVNKEGAEKSESNSKECEQLTALINKKLQKCKQSNNEPPPSIPIELGSAMVGKDNKNNPSASDNDKSKECEELQALVNKKLEKCKQANTEPPPAIPIELGSPIVGKKGKGQATSNAKASESKDCQDQGATMDKDQRKCKQANNEPPPAIPIELGSAMVGKDGKAKPSASQKNEASKDCENEAASSIDKKLEKCKQTNNEPPPAIPIELGSAVIDKDEKQHPSTKQKTGNDKECNKEMEATANKKLNKCHEEKSQESPSLPMEQTSAVNPSQLKENEKKPQPLPLTNNARGFAAYTGKELEFGSASASNGDRRGSSKDEQTSDETQSSRDSTEDYEPVVPPKVPIELGSAASPHPHKSHTSGKAEHAKSKKRSSHHADEGSHSMINKHSSRSRRSVSTQNQSLGDAKTNVDDFSSENLMYLNEMEGIEGTNPSSKLSEHSEQKREFNTTNSKQGSDEKSETTEVLIDHSHASTPVQILRIPDEPWLRNANNALPLPVGKDKSNAVTDAREKTVESITHSGDMEGSGLASGSGRDILTPGDDEWSTSSLDVTSGTSEDDGSTATISSGDSVSFSGSGSGLPVMPIRASSSRYRRNVVDLDDDSLANAEIAMNEHKDHSRSSRSARRKGKKSIKKSKKHKKKNNRLKMIKGGHLKELLSTNIKDPDVKKYILQMSSNVRTVVGQARNVLFSTGQVVHGLRKVISGAGKLSEFAENAVKYANYFARDPDNATIDFLEEKAVIAVLEAQKAAHDAKVEASRAKMAAGKAIAAAKRALVTTKDRSKIEKYAKLAEKAKKKAILAAKRAGEKAKAVKKDALVVDEELRKIINSLPSSKISEHDQFKNISGAETKEFNSTDADTDGNPLSEEENMGSQATRSQAGEGPVATQPENFVLAENKTSVKETEEIPKDEEPTNNENLETVAMKGSNVGTEIETNEVKEAAGRMVQMNSLKDEQQIPTMIERTNVTIVSAKPETNDTGDSLEDIAKNLISAIDRSKHGNSTAIVKDKTPTIDYTAPGGDENYVVADDYRQANNTVSKGVIPKKNKEPVTESISKLASESISKPVSESSSGSAPESATKPNGQTTNSTVSTKQKVEGGSLGRAFKYPVSNIRRFLPMQRYPLASSFQKGESNNPDNSPPARKRHPYKTRSRVKLSEMTRRMGYNVPDYLVRTGNVPVHSMHYLEGYRGFGDALRRDGLIGLEPRADAPVTQDYHNSIKRGQIEEPIYRLTVDPYLGAKDTIIYPYDYALSALNMPKQKHLVAKEVLKSKK